MDPNVEEPPPKVEIGEVETEVEFGSKVCPLVWLNIIIELKHGVGESRCLSSAAGSAVE